MLTEMIIGSRIESRLSELGLNQSELARRVGITQGAISHLVGGGARGSKHIHRIARELGTTPAYLTGETDDPQSESADIDLTPEEERFLEIYRLLDKGGQEAIRNLVDRLAPAPKGKTLHSGRLDYRGGKKK